jgi:tetratricopeptide (TPR) repeat protein
VASNSRIDDLRKRLEKEPGSRLFAQLAEELRKAGNLDEAIAVCRDGLQKHPAYPSARMTLGRALFDKRDLAGARAELESVLKGAPDNILASRLLAECLEGLGDLGAAVDRFRKTLALAPGDRHMAGKVAALDLRIDSVSRRDATPQPAPKAAPDAPIPLVATDEPFELERPYDAPGPKPVAAAQPERVAVPSEVEIEPETEARGAEEPEAEAPSARTLPSSAPSFEPPLPAADLPPPQELFEFDPPPEPLDATNLGQEAPGFEEPSLLVDPPLADRPPGPPPARDFVPEPPRMLPQSEEEPPPPWVAPVAPETTAPELISSTLAELYFNQGFTTKAIQVYQQLLGREPGNERARARLYELQELERAPVEIAPSVSEAPFSTEAPAIPRDGQASRRQAIESVIGRLEGLRAALRRG